MSKAAQTFVSFPPESLDRDSVKLDVVAKGDGWFAVSKPAALPAYPDNWIPRPTDLTRELRRALQAKKPQLVRLGFPEVHRINHLDFEASGIVLFAGSQNEGTRLTNLLGSEQIRFTYRMLVVGGGTGETLRCDLPMGPHPKESRMCISHTHGKKTLTEFALQKRYRGWSEWLAVTTFDRQHQVRLHAMESGIPIVGDRRYGKAASIKLSEFKRGYRGDRFEEEPLYANRSCLHLEQIEFPEADGTTAKIVAPLPKPFSALLRLLGEHASENTQSNGASGTPAAGDWW